MSVNKNGIVDFSGGNIGSNLILNSNAFDGLTKWSNWSNGSDRSVVEIDGLKWLHFKTVNTSSYGGFSQAPYSYATIPFKENTDYTVSAIWFASEPVNVRFWFHMRSSEGGGNILQMNKTFEITSIPALYSYTFNSGYSDTYTINRFGIMIGAYKPSDEDIDIYITNVKFEEGTVATQWVPNENDSIYLGSQSGFIEGYIQASIYDDGITCNHIYEF